jgi:hypothetical protein
MSERDEWMAAWQMYQAFIFWWLVLDTEGPLED